MDRIKSCLEGVIVKQNSSHSPLPSFSLPFFVVLRSCICIFARKGSSNHGKRKYILGGELNSIVAEYRRGTLSRIKYATYKFDATSKLDIPTQEAVGKVTGINYLFPNDFKFANFSKCIFKKETSKLLSRNLIETNKLLWEKYSTFFSSPFLSRRYSFDISKSFFFFFFFFFF